MSAYKLPVLGHPPIGLLTSGEVALLRAWAEDYARTAVAVGSAAEPESSGGHELLTFEFPKHMEHPAGRVNLTAAHLLEYWANKGAIPRYDSVIDELREGAEEIFKAAKPVRPNVRAKPGAVSDSA